MEDKIIMSVGNRLIELTPDEAKQLREKLNAMFGAPPQFVPQPYPLPNPMPSVPCSPPSSPMLPPQREWWADSTNTPPAPPMARVEIGTLSTDGFTW